MEALNLTPQNWPRYHGFVSADWIEGTSYRRFRRYDMTLPLPTQAIIGQVCIFIVLTPSDNQIFFKCDNCFRQHQPTNLNCSMTVHRAHSFLDKTTRLFDFKTQQRIPGRWKQVGIETYGQSRLTVETWKCVHIN
jgi:hypothetical protein